MIDEPICPRCGSEYMEIHCKRVCLRCGASEDCTDSSVDYNDEDMDDS
jgi:ribosomal protein S27AE